MARIFGVSSVRVWTIGFVSYPTSPSLELSILRALQGPAVEALLLAPLPHRSGFTTTLVKHSQIRPLTTQQR